MTPPPRIEIIPVDPLDPSHQAHAIFIKKGTEAGDILSALPFNSLPKGIISISGGARKFTSNANIVKPIQLLVREIVSLAYQHDLLIVDGGTSEGIAKIIGEGFWEYKGKIINYQDPIIIGEPGNESPGQETDQEDTLLNKILFRPHEDNPAIESINPQDDPPIGLFSEPAPSHPGIKRSPMGFVPQQKVKYPGIERPDDYPWLDPNHLYFVLIEDAEDWGDEVESMFEFLKYLGTDKQLPVINIVANGGRITIKEVFKAVEQGREVIVLETSEPVIRAAHVIISALEASAESNPVTFQQKMINSFRDYEVEVQKDEEEETIRWLARIAKHDKITRFNLSRPPNEFRECILSKLGLK